jgi:hypothetical protein
LEALDWDRACKAWPAARICGFDLNQSGLTAFRYNFTAVMERSDETLASLCLAMIAASFAIVVWLLFV